MELPSPFAGKGFHPTFFFLGKLGATYNLAHAGIACAAAAAISSIVELVGSRRYGGGGNGWTADNTARRLIVKSMLVQRPFFLPLYQKKNISARAFIFPIKSFINLAIFIPLFKKLLSI